MFNKIVDVIKEVFWLKPSLKKTKRKSAPAQKKTSKRKSVVKPKASVRPAKAGIKPVAKPVVKTLLKVKTPKVPRKKELVIDPALIEIGEITHYFERIKVCVVKITQGTILIGDRLNVIGPQTRFVQKVWSMQIESMDVKVAKKGQLVGLKMDKPLHVGDKVYK